MASSTTSSVQPRLMEYFREYHSYHVNVKNQATHYVGIPMITIAILGMLSKLQFGPEFFEGFRLNGGVALFVVAMIFYVRLDVKMTLLFGVVGAVFYAIGSMLPIWPLVGLFVVGWIFQYVGHLVYEHKSPAFYKNFEHLLIGPMWIFAKAIGYYK